MNYLNIALKAHQAGNFPEAEGYYLLRLQQSPNDANASQLLGALYFSQGKLQQALGLMQQSLSINPHQPHVANNLALCYKRAGEIDKSQQCFENAIALQADYFEAYKNLISLLLGIEQYPKVSVILDKALAIWPEHKKLLSYLAELKRETQQYEASLAIYQKLLKTDPQNVNYRHDLAVVYRLLGKPKEALVYLLALYSDGLDTFTLAHNIANAYSDLGDLPKALKFYQQAIQLNPEYTPSHQNLNDALWELDQKSGFLRSYVQAFALVGYNNSALCFSYVKSLLRIKNYDTALGFLLALPEGYCKQSEYLDLLAQSQYGLGNIQQALCSHEKMLGLSDSTVEQRLNYIKNLILNEHFTVAKELLDEIVLLNPLEQLALAYLDVCLRSIANAQGPALSHNVELVREYTISPGEGFTNMREYCRALNDYLEGLHTGKKAPIEQTLQGGTQTRGNLFNDNAPFIQGLVAEFSRCVRDYLQQTRHLQGIGPGLQSINDFEFPGSWSVRLTEQGFHTSHMHPMGQISSVFYVALPQNVSDTESKAGWLKFGEPNLTLPRPLPVTQFVKPMLGKLVLFPSYFWHATVPFEQEGVRMTIAFDVAQKT